MSAHWDTIGYLISSKYRLAVVDRLANAPATPTEIATAENLAPSHVSRAIQRLVDRSIVELAVPETQRKNRLYALTPKGTTLWTEIRTAGLH